MATDVSNFQHLACIVTGWCCNALFEKQQRNVIKCTLPFGLDELKKLQLDNYIKKAFPSFDPGWPDL